MRQALHILKKDIHYLWPEIAVVIWLVVAQAAPDLPGAGLAFRWFAPGLTGYVLTAFFAPLLSATAFALSAAGAFMIVRLIQAESTAGDRQFWITRPYRWKSLVAAKAAFLFLFLNLPIFLIRLAVLNATGFPLSASLPLLLWSHLSLMAGAVLPAVALAAMTSGIVSFARFAFLPLGLPLVLGILPWPWKIEWIRSFGLVSVWAGVALTILFLQYTSRRTAVSRILVLVVVAAGAVANMLLPASLGLAAQAALPVGNSAAAARLAEVDIKLDNPNPDDKTAPNVRKIHIGIRGPAGDGGNDGVDGRFDGVRIALEAGDGRVWDSGWFFGPVYLVSAETGATASWIFGLRQPEGFDGSITIDPAFLEAERKNPLTLRASVYVTLLGDSQPPVQFPVTARKGRDLSRTLNELPYRYNSGLQCVAFPAYLPADQSRNFGGRPAEVGCQAPLGWSSLILTGDRVAKNGEVLRYAFEAPGVKSYSPFPQSFWNLNWNLSPTETSAGYDLRAPKDVALNAEDHVLIHIKKPIAHFRRDIVQPVRLDDPPPR